MAEKSEAKRKRVDEDTDDSETEMKQDDDSQDFVLSADEMSRLSGKRFRIPRRKPIAEEAPRSYRGRSVVRIGSWNLLSFTKWKARNPGVREVLCMTILENGISILAAQELAEQGALELIRDELNNPTTPNVKNWKGHRGKWECVTSTIAGMMYRSRECNGFLWDTSREISLTDSGLLKKRVKKKGEKKDFARKPFFAYFKVQKFDFVMLSVHLKATGLRGEDLGRLEKEIDRVPDILEALEDSMPNEKDVIIAGDFNLSPNEKVFDGFRDAGFLNAIENKTFTNISKRHPKGNKTYDNIWILQGNPEKQEYTGRSGVCREGLTHQLIPNKIWEPNGVVSDHCPVWAEFYYGKDYDKSSGKEQLNLSKSGRYTIDE